MIEGENKMKEKRLHFVWKILIFSLFLFAVAGCWQINPNETDFPACKRIIPGFTGKGTIENIQPHEKEFVFFIKSGIMWKSDLGKWTDTTVNYLTLESLPPA